MGTFFFVLTSVLNSLRLQLLLPTRLTPERQVAQYLPKNCPRLLEILRPIAHIHNHLRLLLRKALSAVIAVCQWYPAL
jgi:hypothetical protein